MLARRISLTVLLGSARVIRALFTCTAHTSSTVLLGSAQFIQVSYAGTTYIVDCVIGVSSGHTGIIRWLDVDCVIGVSWGHTSKIRWHNAHRRICYVGVIAFLVK